MYCFSCGAAVAQSLTYCNHCGAKLSRSKDAANDRPAEIFPDSLIWAIVTVFIVGLGSTIALTVVLKEVANFNPGLIVGFTLLAFLMTFLIEAVLVSLLLSRRRGAKDDATKHLKERSTKELDVAQERALPEPALSVTEHTTRTLEPVYRERKVE